MNRNPLTNEIYHKRTRKQTPDVRGEYFRDQTKIIHSLPFRRLKHKTQVFFAPDNDHICTRIEHVLHVATIAAAICRGLNQSRNWELDQDLAYAIGLGHDIGHAPFGHEGERALAACNAPTPFLHEVNSYRVVEHLANYGEGLNLTYAVKDGILCHCGEDFATTQLRPATTANDLDAIQSRRCLPTTYEGCIVRVADKIAYLGRDIEDAVKAGLITEADIPAIVQQEIGTSNGEIINTLTLDLINYSKDKDYIGFSPEKTAILSELKKFNYERIYHNEQMRQRKETIDKCIADLFDSFYLRRDLQRDLDTVRLFRRWSDSNGKKMGILANSGCLRNCPAQTFHDNLVAHQQAVYKLQFDPASAQTLCWKHYQSRKHRVDFLKSSWIRPEDLGSYDDLTDFIKLATRQHDRPDLVIAAYAERSYEGDLAALMEPNFSTLFAEDGILENQRLPSLKDLPGACAANCHHCGKCDALFEKVYYRKNITAVP